MKIYLVVEKKNTFSIRRVIAAHTKGQAKTVLKERFRHLKPHLFRFSEIGHGAKGVPRLIVA